MHVEVFRGKNDHYGFVPSMDPSLLPAQFGPWEYQKAIKLDPEQPRVALDVEQAIADIQKQGWHVNQVKITFEERILPG